MMHVLLLLATRGTAYMYTMCMSYTHTHTHTHTHTDTHTHRRLLEQDAAEAHGTLQRMCHLCSENLLVQHHMHPCHIRARSGPRQCQARGGSTPVSVFLI